MRTTNFTERINSYVKIRPDLKPDDIGILLLIDSLYASLPSDINAFRQLYPHFDPNIINNSAEGIMFLKIAQSKEPTSVIKHRLNQYINIKYNYLGDFHSYEKNMIRFRNHSQMLTSVLDEILDVGHIPQKLKEVLKESDVVRECGDFYDMLRLYKSSKSRRVKFEILRKIGLIVLLSRIQRTYLLNDIDDAIKGVKNVFHKGLGLARKSKKNYYFWLDKDNKMVFCENKRKAWGLYNLSRVKREALGLKSYPLQVFEHSPMKTKFGSEIIHIELRNKLKKKNTLSYTSVIEKMIRKNLEFPNQMHDIIGIKLVIQDEDQIQRSILDLETFLGGSSTRKKEKNSLNKFGKKRLSKYSTREYAVWKAVYDIALPHASIRKISTILSLTKSKKIKKELLNRLEYFKQRPQDVVVEVQLQALDSYLMSLAKGYPAEHSILKMKQIRNNSFYKLYPKEIYEEDIKKLKQKILKG